mmetsp:Transcript_15543/g.23558  ORF Transcript_15543/g.23558 Transcript_15543/m.23558 type:complete len:93 (-) Transcript_15543:653-931(-)
MQCFPRKRLRNTTSINSLQQTRKKEPKDSEEEKFKASIDNLRKNIEEQETRYFDPCLEDKRKLEEAIQQNLENKRKLEQSIHENEESKHAIE